jgi:hypothetical protein
MKGDFSRSTFKREKHYSSVRMQQGRVQLDADWNEQADIQAHLQRTWAEDVVGFHGVPQHTAGFEIRVDGGDLLISSGRIYVNGTLCENERDVLITEQPDLPGFELSTDPGLYLAYLDVWQHHVTALEDPDIREVALGGADTTTRTKTVWQVKLEHIGNGDDAVDSSILSLDWLPEGASNSGQLRARVRPDGTDDGLPTELAQAGYRGLENRLYRVEIHEGSDRKKGPTFKWSRDNGSLVAHLQKIDGNTLTISDPGRNILSCFAPGQWVELSNEGRILRGELGVLVQLAAVESTELTIKAWPDGGSPVLGEQPTVRRWDSVGAIPVTFGDYLDLEEGVQVKFAKGEYRTGDYWMVPARTATGDVEWSRDDSGPMPQPPHGIQHRYCQLALLELRLDDEDSPTWEQREDRRFTFPSLADLKEMTVLQVAIDAPDGAIYVDQDGNVGIGTKELSEKLEVNGNINCRNNELQKPVIAGYTEKLVTTSDSEASCDIDLSNGNVFDVTLSEDCEFRFVNPPMNGTAGSFTLILRNTTGRTITWPDSVHWPEGESPEIEGVTILCFVSVDEGSIWYGFLGGANFSKPM